MAEPQTCPCKQRLDCEEPFRTITGGLSALRVIWDSVAHGACKNDDRLQQALHFALRPTEDAADELGRQLGL